MQPLREISRDELLARFNTVSDKVRALFVSEESTERVHKISDELQLPEFIQEILGREVGYAILGLKRPEDSIATFVGIGASQELAEAIVKRVANDILIEIVQEASAGQLSPAEPSQVPLDHQIEGQQEKTSIKEPVAIPRPQVPVPSYAPVLSSNTPSPTQPPVIPVPVPAPTPVKIPTPPQIPVPPPMPESVPESPVFVPEVAPLAIPVAPPPPPQPIRPRTMASDVEALQNPGEATSRPQATVRPVFSAVPPQTIPLPPEPVSIPPQPVTPAPVLKASVVHEDLKKYGVDPYREPIT